MKKLKKVYLIIWGIIALLFLMMALFVPEQIGEWSKKDSAFWGAVVMMMLVMAGNLGLSMIFFDKGTKEQTFLKLPIAYIGFVILGITFVLEVICVVLPNGKNWMSIAIGIILLIVYGILAFGTFAATNQIKKFEKKQPERTVFIRNLRVEAELLEKQTVSEAVRKQVGRICEALRYSDPCSDSRLDEVEGRLYVAFSEFAKEIKRGEEKQCEDEAEKVLQILEERNAKCKLLK
ncbi:MAG: hypothetical protein PUC12_12215 [Clostridiales bacterium]|nr:hypothetical protein [Clostridiales bacterium]